MTTLADVIVSADDEAPVGNPETEAAPAAASEAPAPAAAPSVPEKFRGKTAADVVEMYQNLESRYGTMANDLGVQRQLTDRLLDLNNKRDRDLQANTPPAQKVPVTASDLLDKPQETLERVIEERVARVTQDVNQRLANAEAALARQSFANRHPDYQSVVNDAKFIDWLKAKPLRQRAAIAANQGNWEIADELLSDYKESTAAAGSSVPTEAPPAPRADLEGARRAALETSGSAGASDGKSGGGKKIHRRVDLMKMRLTDPDAYHDESFQAEILQAYAEGRVK